MSDIEFRFPGGRWERSPIQDVTAALVMLSNYDLRIDGETYPTATTEPTP